MLEAKYAALAEDRHQGALKENLFEMVRIKLQPRKQHIFLKVVGGKEMDRVTPSVVLEELRRKYSTNINSGSLHVSAAIRF